MHLFHNLYVHLVSEGHHVYVTTKNITSVVTLLNQFKISFINLGDKPDGFFNKVTRQLYFTKKIIQIVRQKQIDICLGVSVSIAQASLFTKMKSIVLDDDDFQATPVFALASHTFASHILVPDCSNTLSLKKILKYPGYHELSYLHPNIFKPDKNVLLELELKEGEHFFILRFNAFKAHHDIGIKGLSEENKHLLVDKLSKYGKVFISGEANLEPEFQKYQLPTSSEKIHSVLYFATMLISDSQTMTSEAAVLGTPALRMNSFVGRISYLEEQEKKYGLTYGFLPDNYNGLLSKIDELLSIPNLKNEWHKRQLKMLQDKIDVTAFLVWFVENYPSSVEILEKEPDYAEKFK